MLLLYACCLVLAVVIALVFERIDGTPGFEKRLILWLPRLLVPSFIYSFFYLLTWRPLTALGLFAAGGIILFAANKLKRAVVFEPIVFSDLALLGQILRHPHLYFLDRNLHLSIPGAALSLLLVAAAVAIEPTVTPPSWLVASLAISAAMVWLARQKIERRYKSLLLDSTSGWGSSWLGLPAALTLQTIGAFSQGRADLDLPELVLPEPARDVVVLQLESFIDLSEWPGIDHNLPFWNSLKSRAQWHGSLIVDARGANTMRTEFSVLTGLAGEDLGFERFDPYLRRHQPGRGIPHRLREAGWLAIFIHPNDIAFFRRQHAIPELGFDRIAEISSFAEAERVGPYVSDAAVVDQILKTFSGTRSPAFIFAVSMENHGPWRAGRQPGKSEGLATYLAHQDNMDRALGRLTASLKARPSPPILVLYGDHTPALKDQLDIALYGYPNYMIIDLMNPATNTASAKDMRPEALLPSALRLAASPSSF